MLSQKQYHEMICRQYPKWWCWQRWVHRFGRIETWFWWKYVQPRKRRKYLEKHGK